MSANGRNEIVYGVSTCSYLIIFSSISGLVAKVTYDYWIFKSAGYLPWPANKMPRLPCDWLCE